MRLLFYQNAEASDAQLDLINSVTRSVRTSYSALIDEMGERHASNLDWWVSELAARNIFATPLFTRLCQLAAVRRLIDEGKRPSQIIVDSWPLYHIFKLAGLPVRLKLSPTLFARFIAKPIYNFVTSVGMFTLRWLAGRHGRFPERATLIHTFAHASMFRDGWYIDRYFGEMLSELDEERRKRCFYVPAPIRTWNYFRLFRLARSAVRGFLLREDYLKFSDYLYALFFPFRYARLKSRAPSFSGFEIGPLIRATKWYSLASPSSLEGLLAFRFAKRIRRYAGQIDLVVDWFENQAMNHGMNAGIRWNMPGVPTKGYQGFLNPDMMVSTFPTAREVEHRVVPEEIVVMGSGWVGEKKEFCPSLEVKVAPAFRYQHLLKEPSLPLPSDRKIVLVALPLQVDESVVILSLMRKAIDRLDYKPVVVIKPHPYLALERVRLHFPNAQWVSGDFSAWLEKAAVLVSSCSSVCLEAVMWGVPSLIVRGPDGMAYSPIPSQVPMALWRICLDDLCLAVALKHFAENAVDASALAKLPELRKSYFTESSADATKRFLDFNA